MSTVIEINHNGLIQSTESAPYSELPKLVLKPHVQFPKPSEPSLEIRYHEKEDWYIVADGIVFTRR